MEDILIHLIIVAPCIRYILNPQRHWNKRGRRLSQFAAALILIFSTCLQFFTVEPTHYAVLGLESYAEKNVIGSTYRQLMLKYHPDLANSPIAAAKFDQVREAYEVLSNNVRRHNYDRFGDIDSNDISLDNARDIFIFSLFHFIVPLIMSVLFTMDAPFGFSRKIFVHFGIFVFFVDYLLRFGDHPPDHLWFIPFFGAMPEFQKIRVLRALNSTLMSLLSIWAAEIVEYSRLEIFEAVGEMQIAALLEILRELDRIIAWFTLVETTYPQERPLFTYTSIKEPSAHLTTRINTDLWSHYYFESFTEFATQGEPILSPAEIAIDSLTMIRCKNYRHGLENRIKEERKKAKTDIGDIGATIGTAFVVMTIFYRMFGGK